jgi:hypothetical protein
MRDRKSAFMLAVVCVMSIWVVTVFSGVASAGNEGDKVHFKLSGAQEVPQNVHGNKDRGAVTVFFQHEDEGDESESPPTEGSGATTEICFKFGRLVLSPGEPLPFMGHIHNAPEGVAGPIVLHIFGSGDGTTAPTSYPTDKICRQAPAGLIEAILDNSDDYYVNLHNTTHGSGVVRGQFPQDF